MMVGSLQQVSDLIFTRQNWFLSSPRVSGLPPEKHDSIKYQGLTLAGLLRAVLTPEAMQLETLQTSDFRTWLLERDQVAAPHVAQLHEYSNSNRQITVESEKDGIAVVAISDLESLKLNYTNIEGYWVEAGLADQWTESVQAIKQEITDAPSGTYLDRYAMMVGNLIPALGPMRDAEDASEFHVAMESMIGPLEGLTHNVASFLEGSSVRRPPSNLYDDEEMEEDEEEY